MRNKSIISKTAAKLLFGSGMVLYLIGQSACIQHRQLINFDTGPAFDSLIAPAQTRALRIQRDDLIAISVQSEAADSKITAPFTSASAASVGVGGSTKDAPDYLVDINGQINMPLIGRVYVAGLTTQQARDTLVVHLSRFVKNPIVNVRLSNFRFAVLGEVNRAGTYTVGYERVTMLEALGLAGDLTKYGNRENILVIRETDGKRRYGRVNLHQRDVFQSEYFFVEQGDIIYVEPLKAKLGDTTDAATKYLQWALPIVSVVGLLVTLFSTK